MPNPRAQKNANLRSTATGVYDAVTQGLLPMLGNAARGSVAATLGAPGDLLGLLSDKQPLPTSQNILDYIPPVGSDKALTGMAETMGGFIPTPGAGAVAKGAGRAVKTALNPMTYGRAFVEAQAPAVMSPITAWHGSPHKFRKFDNSKMGTGEGAQAYGAGAYLADDPAVANQYRINLSYDPSQMKVGGKQINDLYDQIQNRAARLSNQQASAEYEKLQVLEDLMLNRMPDELKESVSQMSPVTQKWFESTVVPSFQTYGHLYKADIPDEAVANMLLWDKPLSEQPESVKRALGFWKPRNSYEIIEREPYFKKSQFMVANKDTGSGVNYFPTKDEAEAFIRQISEDGSKGSNIYNSLGKDASNVLLKAGIPGIRYLDAGSRGQGAGTMNTVVFDDSIIKILERNGVPLGLLAD